MFRNVFVLLLAFFCFLKHLIHCDTIIVDSNDAIDNFDKETVLNLDDKVFNIFLDKTATSKTIINKYQNVLKYSTTINESCGYVKDLIKGRNLKYFDELETKKYANSNDIYTFSIYVYTAANNDDINGIYKKHPNYISYLTACKEGDIFDNLNDVKQNKNVYHTNPTILSQEMIIILMIFFLFIGFYALINISTPRMFEERQLMINKEH
ncbi:conserved Plasmodium protein, unknown function [Plasmodium berghei]|uniref:Uncharacterized protein n=2 Tax=Plasmodium berghei TaxID=5821 RepID=A0A509AU47_PLABA|nr:conserved Plasmodium protein, unknown function [Plasmodium berghei ANKA]CXJ15982.1 conserved Plasmodium protein, unknown function [Plasmodium berghei]SCM26287.1 conserved Plasmodium protein, unknown function [Plasmodium berghei]SCN28375.1 conserved Plasmodium protein, unknown function [Plasmodium berghei]SCO62571.1 conserved Plasmodium protein, unknown function [Plasmodium berghei]SCO64128.1 conserved Plasmodium protein, unknown function [Plasmodium berghei]|eukprot:XP_034424025.1 conserved Plasmodium protein, unknown function [Plasmodium berghei ANKA]